MKKKNIMLHTVTGVGIFSSLAFIATLVCKLIPSVGGFLSLDAKDAVIAIASFIYGPIVAPVISLITAFIEFVTISDTGWYGFIMNFASSATFSLVASLIYKYKKSFNGAVIGFASAVAATGAAAVTITAAGKQQLPNQQHHQQYSQHNAGDLYSGFGEK